MSISVISVFFCINKERKVQETIQAPLKIKTPLKKTKNHFLKKLKNPLKKIKNPLKKSPKPFNKRFQEPLKENQESLKKIPQNLSIKGFKELFIKILFCN